MANVDDLRKLLAPELMALKEGLRDLRSGIQDIRSQALAGELRLTTGIETMKTEILLTVKVNSQQERIVELTRENQKLKAERAQ